MKLLKSSMDPIDLFPLEIWISISEFLDSKSKIKLSLTCVTFYNTIINDLYHIDFNIKYQLNDDVLRFPIFRNVTKLYAFNNGISKMFPF